MIITNQTTSDIYFGPLHLGGGIGTTLTVDDTTATSLYLTNDSVADAINNAYQNGQITVTSAADPFPRPTGEPKLLHGTGNPEGLVYAPQGSIYMRRDGAASNGGVIYSKTTGVTYATGWVDIPIASGASVASPTGAIFAYGGPTAPSGWLLCDGSAVSRTTYSLLFAVVGTAYGAGDGSTTFNLPDLRGRVAVGYAPSGGHTDVSTLGNNDGAALASRRPKHSHGIGSLAAANESSHTHGHGTYAISGGSHAHDVQLPNDQHAGDWTTNPGLIGYDGNYGQNTVTKYGAALADTHSHPSTEWSGSSGAGTAHTHALSGSVGTTSSAPSESAAYVVINHIIKT